MRSLRYKDNKKIGLTVYESDNGTLKGEATHTFLFERVCMQLHPPPNALPMEALDHGETLKAKSLLANMRSMGHISSC